MSPESIIQILNYLRVATSRGFGGRTPFSKITDGYTCEQWEFRRYHKPTGFQLPKLGRSDFQVIFPGIDLYEAKLKHQAYEKLVSASKKIRKFPVAGINFNLMGYAEECKESKAMAQYMEDHPLQIIDNDDFYKKYIHPYRISEVLGVADIKDSCSSIEETFNIHWMPTTGYCSIIVLAMHYLTTAQSPCLIPYELLVNLLPRKEPTLKEWIRYQTEIKREQNINWPKIDISNRPIDEGLIERVGRIQDLEYVAKEVYQAMGISNYQGIMPQHQVINMFRQYDIPMASPGLPGVVFCEHDGVLHCGYKSHYSFPVEPQLPTQWCSRVALEAHLGFDFSDYTQFIEDRRKIQAVDDKMVELSEVVAYLKHRQFTFNIYEERSKGHFIEIISNVNFGKAVITLVIDYQAGHWYKPTPVELGLIQISLKLSKEDKLNSDIPKDIPADKNEDMDLQKALEVEEGLIKTLHMRPHTYTVHISNKSYFKNLDTLKCKTDKSLIYSLAKTSPDDDYYEERTKKYYRALSHVVFGPLTVTTRIEAKEEYLRMDDNYGLEHKLVVVRNSDEAQNRSLTEWICMTENYAMITSDIAKAHSKALLYMMTTHRKCVIDERWLEYRLLDSDQNRRDRAARLQPLVNRNFIYHRLLVMKDIILQYTVAPMIKSCLDNLERLAMHHGVKYVGRRTLLDVKLRALLSVLAHKYCGLVISFVVSVIFTLAFWGFSEWYRYQVFIEMPYSVVYGISKGIQILVHAYSGQDCALLAYEMAHQWRNLLHGSYYLIFLSVLTAFFAWIQLFLWFISLSWLVCEIDAELKFGAINVTKEVTADMGIKKMNDLHLYQWVDKSVLRELKTYWMGKKVTLNRLIMKLSKLASTKKTAFVSKTVPAEYINKLAKFAPAGSIGALWAFLLRATKPIHKTSKMGNWLNNHPAVKQILKEMLFELNNMELPTFEDYLEHIEPRKRSLYRRAYKLFLEKPEICRVMEIFAKEEEKQYKECRFYEGIEDYKVRNIFNPREAVKAMGGYMVHIMSKALKQTKTFGENYSCAKSPEVLDGLITQACRTVNDWIVFTYDGEFHDVHQHKRFLSDVDNRIIEECVPLIMRRLGFTIAHIIALVDNMTRLETPVRLYRRDKRLPRGHKLTMILEGTIHGTVFSGHPSRTSFGNTLRILVMSLAVCMETGLRWNIDLHHFQAGDDTLIIISKSLYAQYRMRLDEIYSPDGYGLKMKDPKLAYDMDFLSKHGWMHETAELSRLPPRVLQTGLYSTKLKEMEEMDVFDIAITKQLAAWGVGVYGVGDFVKWRQSQEKTLSRKGRKLYKNLLEDMKWMKMYNPDTNYQLSSDLFGTESLDYKITDSCQGNPLLTWINNVNKS